LQNALSVDEEIRTVVDEDIEEILKIERRSFASPWTRRIFEETLLSPISNGFVLRKGGALIGYILSYAVGDEGHILNLAIHPDLRRRAYGLKLLSHALARLGATGVTDFYLEVREHNLAAINLYGEFGFEVIGRRKKYYPETNEDALVMRLSLLKADA
jgi:[ribosomal protein S18]-alanine N-acetyltransferase